MIRRASNGVNSDLRMTKVSNHSAEAETANNTWIIFLLEIDQ